MAGKGNLILVCQEIMADTETPVSVYLRVKGMPYSYLLESADRGERWGRYSIIGFDPYLTVLSYCHETEVADKSGNRQSIRNPSNPLLVLRALCRRFRPVEAGLAPLFQGGFVGYCNYDLMGKWERLPGRPHQDEKLPEAVFTISQRLIVFDHLKHTVKVAALSHLEDETDLKEAYAGACRSIDETMNLLQSPVPASNIEPFALSKLHGNFSKEEFEQAVERAKEYIVSGDVIQVVLSQRLSGEASGDAFALYRNLRSINPSPYMFYLNFGDIRLIGASPEILVRLTGNRIQLRPIAGTRPRGHTREEDLRFEKELVADPKERAEHIMLVDLGRNDVGRVAAPGSVSVPRLMEVERYSHVMHLVSHVEGRLRSDKDAFDLFMSAFPAGTVSGAPKIRAMEIINELEPTPRGPYAGAVGYFGFNGNMDFCITIRTIAVAKNRLSVQVGAGIVADSSPEGEYNETLGKAAAMLKSIEEAKRDDSGHRQL
ncbi:MAG: anthranilate synthase component I [Deltaproteobacteria bacterium]|nr:anthranilate synthase component I [Deltaproteobacteria bacterium]